MYGKEDDKIWMGRLRAAGYSEESIQERKREMDRCFAQLDTIAEMQGIGRKQFNLRAVKNLENKGKL